MLVVGRLVVYDYPCFDDPIGVRSAVEQMFVQAPPVAVINNDQTEINAFKTSILNEAASLIASIGHIKVGWQFASKFFNARRYDISV